MMNLLDKYRIPCYTPEGGGSGGSSSQPPTESSPSSSGSGSTGTSESPSTPASPAPSAAPTTGSPHEPAPAGVGEAFDFSSIFEGSEEVAPPEVKPAAATPAAQPKEPAAPPVTAAPAEAPQAAPPAPAAAPPTPSPATPQAPAATPELDRYDPAMLARHLATNEEMALNYVAENVFRLSPSEIEALETNVHEAIPKLLAKVFVKSQQNVLSQLASMVPVMIQRQSVMMQRNAENMEKFYQRWPAIKKDQHGDLVLKYGAVYRQMHPNADLNQLIEELGPMVMMRARIVPTVGVQAPVGQPANPAAQRAANGRSPPPSPFVPAGGIGPAATATAPELSPWEAMFRQED